MTSPNRLPDCSHHRGDKPLRNAMAHAFFPENLRAYHMKGPPAPRKPIPVLYRGDDIFSAAGAKKFVDDCAQVTQFLRKKLKRRRDRTQNAFPISSSARLYSSPSIAFLALMKWVRTAGSWSNAVNGFRAWTQRPDKTLTICKCNWAGVKLPVKVHYRKDRLLPF